MDPTHDPSGVPTIDPTNIPTFDPTLDPTQNPTYDPTSNPTHRPTIEGATPRPTRDVEITEPTQGMLTLFRKQFFFSEV